VLEIADILDELNSIDRLFESQIDALRSLGDILPPTSGYSALRVKVEELVVRDIRGYQKQVGRMMSDARRTKDSVRLNPLLSTCHFPVIEEAIILLIQVIACGTP
jgi:hypothetical protein